MKNQYQLIVGNVGTVYEGTNGFNAIKDYNQYVKLSKESTGRVSGESVTLIRNDEIYREYEGTLNQD
jgi:hypothetical protein